MPVMAFSGVLISCDILAMKLDFTLFADSASCFAISRSAWIFLRFSISLFSLSIQKSETVHIAMTKNDAQKSFLNMGP